MPVGLAFGEDTTAKRLLNKKPDNARFSLKKLQQRGGVVIETGRESN